MKPLDEIYKGGFFKNRHRLAWRSDHFCNAVVKTFNPSSVIDVGCAIGENVRKFMEMGVDAYGLEGSINSVDFFLVPSDRIYIRDLRKLIPIEKKFDLVICFEVAEHIEPEYANVFLINLMNLSNRILISAAPPGQGGHYHVNCQPKKYWVNKFKDFRYNRNYEYEIRFKNHLKEVANRKEVKAIHDNILYFGKE